MKKLSFFSLCFSVALLFASCTKEGPMGPAGPAGPQGPAGTNGTNGTNGTQGSQGPAGTANVIYSTWTDASLTWTDTTIATVQQRVAEVNATSVTEEIIERGVVLAFSRTTDGTVHSMPTMLHSENGTDIFRFSLKVGVVTFAHSKLRNTGFVAPAAQDIRFRYVIIPGGTANTRIASGAAAGYTAAQLQAMSYDQVVALFRIPK